MALTSMFIPILYNKVWARIFTVWCMRKL